jgi:periplasmic divalent cation tolerance protein
MIETHSTMGLLYTTWPNQPSAEAAARTLLDERLIACANILGASTSIYRWQGEVETAQEIIVLFKTSTAKADAARARITALHPYNEPAILNLAVHAEGTAPGFLTWVERETSGGGI